MSQHRDVDGVGMLGIDDDLGDSLGIRKPHQLPVIAGIGRFVDSRAHRGAVAHPRLARAHPNCVGMGLIYRDGPDGLRVLVEYGFEADSSVDGFPNAAAGRAYVDDPRIAGYAVDGCNAATSDGWSNGPRFDGAKRGGIDFDLSSAENCREQSKYRRGFYHQGSELLLGR